MNTDSTNNTVQTDQRLNAQTELDIVIDGCAIGGAEVMLLNLLPTLMQRFPKSEINFLNVSGELYSEFNKYLPSHRRSIFSLLRLMGGSPNRAFYLHLSKSSFLAIICTHFHSAFNPKKNLTKKFFIHEHTTFEYHLQSRSLLKRAFGYIYVTLVKHAIKNRRITYIVQTNARLRELQNLIGNHKNLICIQNAIPLTKQEELKNCRTEYNPMIGEIRLLTFSRIIPEKRIDWAILAAVEVAKHSENDVVTLRICGQGPDEIRLRQFTQVGVPINLRIEFAGGQKKILDELSKADFYLFPSKLEGFGLTLLEAAESGITCISYNCKHGPADIAAAFSNVILVEKESAQCFAMATVNEVKSQRNKSVQADNSSNKDRNWPPLEKQAQLIADLLEPANPDSTDAAAALQQKRQYLNHQHSDL